ncbi:response regulator [Clostridium sp. MCC353]|uniref:ATP-binding protein n=1 Tax=Clostridium sp. MCC353 TaxID=2592646 RepID=UPI001C00C2BC|nr:response regulator [Clostridium sp. MCC353]
MEERRLRQAEDLAKKILRKYFCESDMEFMISTFAEDIIWVGGGEHQTAKGKEAVTRAFLKGKEEMLSFRMWDEHYESARIDDKTYLCSCDSMMETDPAADSHMKVRQRCTFVFREKGDTFETVHIHNSVPFAGIGEEELFPVRAAKEAYERLESLTLRQDRQLDLILNQLSGGMIICSIAPPYHVEWMSDNLTQLLGYTNYGDFALHTGNRCLDFIEPEDYKWITSRVNEQLKAGDVYNLEYRVHTRTGEILWISEKGRSVIEPGNREVLYAVLIDVTERKHQELKLEEAHREIRQTAEFLTQLYQTVPCGIIQFTADEEHLLLNENRMAWEIYGYTEEEYRREIRSPFQLLLEKDKAKVQEYLRHMTLESGPVSYTREFIRKDGKICWISVIMERLINAQGRDVIQAIYSDVTETKELQIRQQQEQILENQSLRAAIWTVYQAIMSINLTRDTYNFFMEQGNALELRREGCYQEFLEKVESVIHPSQRGEYIERFCRNGVLRSFSKGSEEIYMEAQLKNEDGIYHWLSIQIIHVDNPYGDEILAIMLIKLLDEERAQKAKQEQVLKEALAEAQEANRAKSDFLSRISHDIRTPMNAIIGMSALGKINSGDPEKLAECFDKIDSSSKYLLSLLNDVLDMSRIESGKIELNRERFEFREFVESLCGMIQPQADEKGQQFLLSCDPELYRPYTGDYLRLHQILANLLVNAVKFTPHGGRISLEIRNGGRTKDGLVLEFKVSDNGIGMSEEFLERLYEPFEQESSDQARNLIGTGLGLSIVSNLVQLMDGTIEVESKKKIGTVFKVCIPVRPADGDLGVLENETAIEEIGNLQHLRVLLVEDNELNREIAEEMLKMKDIVVETAGDGVQAVELFGKRPEYWYDAVLMDIRMPNMDGIRATKTIRSMERADAKNVPVIAMTANAFDADREEAKKAGVDEYLIKPLDMNLLFQALDRIKKKNI